MALLEPLVRTLCYAVSVLLIVRATTRLRKDPATDHDELVPKRERRATTVVGVPLLLVGLSTMVGGPLAVGLPPLPLAVAGSVLGVYPNFEPSALG